MVRFVPGWTKYFDDDSIEIGTDQLVKQKKASWSRGRLGGIVGVEVSDGVKVISVMANVSDKWWQCDRCISVFSGMNKPGKTLINQRIIEKEITDKDLGPVVCITADPIVCLYINMYEHPRDDIVMTLKECDIGKWLIILLDSEHHEVIVKISDKRV